MKIRMMVVMLTMFLRDVYHQGLVLVAGLHSVNSMSNDYFLVQYPRIGTRNHGLVGEGDH